MGQPPGGAGRAISALQLLPSPQVPKGHDSSDGAWSYNGSVERSENAGNGHRRLSMRDIFARLLAIGDADPTPRGAVLAAIVGVPIGVVAFWLCADEPPSGPRCSISSAR